MLNPLSKITSPCVLDNSRSFARCSSPRLYFWRVIATRAPRESKMHPLEEIEPRGQYRDGLVREPEKVLQVLRHLAARPEERFRRTR
jgi:hypothetical protein